VRGNANWMRAREATLESALFGADAEKIKPIIDETGSDSTQIDNALELLIQSGRSIAHSFMMLIPEAWSSHEHMEPYKKEFYEYHATMMEPWDGPASIVFTDGRFVGGSLDRNGLRPSRYCVTEDDLVVMGSETGVVSGIHPADVRTKGRLQPGRMFLVDMQEGRIIRDEEIKELQEKASPAIEITEFVPLTEVEPIYFEKSYYLGPEKGGERAYRLLSEAMRKTGRSALAKHAARGKQYLVMLRPYGSGLLMQQLKYEDELKSFDEVPLGEETELKPGELELAVQLIEQIASDDFKPDQYTDDVRKRLWDAIQSKIDGRELADDETEAPQAQIIDLMEALKASLSKNGEAEVDATAESKPAKKATQRKATKKKRVRRAASAPAKRAVAG